MSEEMLSGSTHGGRFAVLPDIEDVLDRMTFAELLEVLRWMQEKYPHHVNPV